MGLNPATTPICLIVAIPDELAARFPSLRVGNVAEPPRIALWDDTGATVMMTPQMPEEGKIPLWR
jgi:hypothetical protein